MLVLKEARNLATRSLASFLAALMSSTDCAKRLFWRSLAALRAAFMRDEACERAASASARSLAMVARTSWNFLAVWAVTSLILSLVAEARVARAFCWFSTASWSSLAPSCLFLRMISRVLWERLMVSFQRWFSSLAEAANLRWVIRMAL